MTETDNSFHIFFFSLLSSFKGKDSGVDRSVEQWKEPWAERQETQVPGFCHRLAIDMTLGMCFPFLRFPLTKYNRLGLDDVSLRF